MNSARKTLPLLVATLASFTGTTAGAVGLGELVAHSSLGEPLRAEIRLIRSPGEQIDPTCIKSIGGDAGRDDIPWLHNARIKLSGDYLSITTRDPVNHPIAMLGLRVACGNEFRRDYPILLQPPINRIASPVVAQTPGDYAAPAISETRRPSSRRAAERTYIADGTEAPARQPARTHRPKPSPSNASQVAAGPASNPVATPAQPARAPETPRTDRLVIGAGDEANLAPLHMAYQLANPPKSEEPGKARPQLPPEQRTLAEIDDRIAAQLELDEKIKRLEEYQALLKDRVSQLDKQGRPARPIAASNTPPPPPAKGTFEQIKEWAAPLAAPLTGLLAVAIGAGALVWIRRSRQNAEPGAVDHTEPSTQTDFRISAPPRTIIEPETPLPSMPEMRQAPLSQQTHTQQAGDNTAEWAEPTFAPAHPIPFDETVDEQDSALELAEIMMSFGRTQGAAETLADYIRNNPRQAVKPWLKLLDVYHVAGMRAEFEALTRQLNKTFNVKMISWGDFKAVRSTPDSIEQISHVMQRLQEQWGTQEAQAYIHQILRDNRNGTRQGFPLNAVEELLLLLAILDDQLGPYKPPVELSLETMEPPSKDTAAA
jgi:pilus assembly protein FimV